jgi:hypothetical protein
MTNQPDQILQDVEIQNPIGFYTTEELSSRQPAVEPLKDSYRNQSYRFSFGAQLKITPSRTVSFAPELSKSVAFLNTKFPLYFFTAWNKSGQPTTWDANVDAEAAARDALSQTGLRTGTGFSRSSDGSWLEGWFYTETISDERALQIASDLGQPAAVRWDADGLHVLSLDQSVVPNSSTGWILSEDKDRPCQLKAEVSATACGEKGGKFVAKSRAIGAIWQVHRANAIRLAGCTVCKREPNTLGTNPGDAIPLHEVFLASRFGGYAFGKFNHPNASFEGLGPAAWNL